MSWRWERTRGEDVDLWSGAARPRITSTGLTANPNLLNHWSVSAWAQSPNLPQRGVVLVDPHVESGADVILARSASPFSSLLFSLRFQRVTDAVALLTAGGTLEANGANSNMTAKPREPDLRSAAVSCQETSAQAMASRKLSAKTSALPQGSPRSSASELRVYQPASGSIPIPVPNPSGLRKQRSLSNLCVLTDAEKKLHLYQSPRWNDGAGGNKQGQGKTGQSGIGKPSLSRTLSKSEQSLFQGKPKPFCSPSPSPNVSKPSRIPAPGKPRGPYAEVRPIKASEGGQAADTETTDGTTAKSGGAGNSEASGKKVGEKGRSLAQSAEVRKEKKGTEGEEDKSFLKVDPELVVTVLGDLEQLLFSQMLGESAIVSLYVARCITSCVFSCDH